MELYEAAFTRSLGRRLEQCRYRINQYRLRFQIHDPIRQIHERRQQLADWEDQMGQILEQKLMTAKHRLALASGRLHGLSPLERISGGFGFVTGESGARIAHVRDVREDEVITVRISDGSLKARVLERTLQQEDGREG